jgi:uncharacterized membrane protein YfcA
MTSRDRLRGLIAGLGAGAASGLFGVGGGLVLVPALSVIFGCTQHQAVGTSLAIIGATALTALVVYGAHANVVWIAAVPMALGSAATASLGAKLATRVPAARLRQMFAAFLVLVALRLLWQPPAVAETIAWSGVTGVVGFLLLGLAAGVLAGFMGVGGGIVVVPVLTLVFGMSQQQAQGTSLAVMLVTAPAAAFEHSRSGNVVWRLVPVLAIGTVLGSPLAAWAAQDLPHAWLTRGFALFLLATAIHTWIRSSPGESTAKRGPNADSTPPERVS